jgi:uncharacterized protein
MTEVAIADPPPLGARRQASSAVLPFETDYGPHLLVVDGSQIFAITEEMVAQLHTAMEKGEDGAELLERYGITISGFIGRSQVQDPPLRTLSLSVAQACNLGCSYCYAQGGAFGGAAKVMSWPVAKSAIDRLFAGATEGERVFLSFLGGEPTLNRRLIRQCTDYATGKASASGIGVGFALTSNATLLTDEDAAYFESHGFSVTVSIDGLKDAHDRLRPLKRGGSSYDLVMAGARRLLAVQETMQVSARVTVTPRNLDLQATLEGLIAEGFHSVGFSPMLSAPNGREEMAAADLQVMLAQMIACGEAFMEQTKAGQRYPFSNILMALRHIHEGTHRPYPCGAGAGYLAASAEGELFACHRFIDDPAGRFGDLERGVDPTTQQNWLAERHVDRQEPCRSCWARYLCGGGCHHEVIHRGRPACDYIRGWLAFCLRAYVELSEERPELFGVGQP